LSALICPHCGSPLFQEEKRAVCSLGHSFDRAGEGYFNLLCARDSGGHGDDREMLRARREFLDRGYYRPLLCALQREALARFPQGGVWLDAGCGEGYYTQGIGNALRQAGKSPRGYAFDISKYAVRMCAKRCRGEDVFFVASVFHIPITEASADLIFSLFSPYAEEEFLRVLKPGGYLIRAVPLEDHLYSLKRAVYASPKRNLTRAEIGAGFFEEKEKRIRASFFLPDSQTIRALFQMTPYAHKTSPEDVRKLEALTELETQMDLGIQILRKN